MYISRWHAFPHVQLIFSRNAATKQTAGTGVETKYRDLLYFFKTNPGAKPEEKEPPAAPAG